MSDAVSVEAIGVYCRRVERHLTQANGGHLVRVVGPGFELVRQWALDGVPLSVVFRAIDDKAERHREGGSRHPLRIEFCESDVRQAFDHWRRAVGVTGTVTSEVADADETSAGSQAEPKRPSFSRHLDRVIDRLTRVSGRLNLPEALRDAATATLDRVVALREEARGARGARKEALLGQLPAIDREVAAMARSVADDALLAELRRQAEGDLAPYRGRISPDDWRKAVDVTLDRLLRERYGLPTVDLA